jgi:hypothetical protein
MQRVKGSCLDQAFGRASTEYSLVHPLGEVKDGLKLPRSFSRGLNCVDRGKPYALDRRQPKPDRFPTGVKPSLLEFTSGGRSFNLKTFISLMYRDNLAVLSRSFERKKQRNGGI